VEALCNFEASKHKDRVGCGKILTKQKQVVNLTKVEMRNTALTFLLLLACYFICRLPSINFVF